MNRPAFHTRAIAGLGAVLLAGTAGAQERSAPAPVLHLDVKTAPEVAQPVVMTPEPDRQSAGPRAELPAKLDGPESGTRVQLDHARMFYDEPGDGNVWARGTDYKASFGAQGATYFPRLGPRAPRNAPHALSPDLVTIGGETVAFARAASAVRDGDRVELDRGAFVEAYDLSPGSIEQTFVFASLPQRGDLVVRIPVASELEGRRTDAGLEFRGETARVTYSRAIAIDGAGRRSLADTELVDGAITIRVDERFVASAALPLVIDPVVSTYVIDGGPTGAFAADVAWNQNYFCSLVAYEEEYSANDHDIRVRILNYDGTVRHDGYVDFTTDSWGGPRCGNLQAQDQCLVAATKYLGSGNSAVVGREVGMLDLAMYPQITISRPEDGPAARPVVGGDPYQGTAAYYCVAYDRVYSPTDLDILVRLVKADNTFLNPTPIFLSNSGSTMDLRPAISKSNDTSEWMIVWDRQLVGDNDVWGARVRWDGTVTATPFSVSVNSEIDWRASVSSPLPNTLDYLVAFERGSGAEHDIVLRYFRLATLIDELNLSVAEHSLPTLDQVEATVDAHQDHFVVAYSEEFAGADYDIYASDVGVSADELVVTQPHVNLAFSSSAEHRPRIAGLAAAGEPTPALQRDHVLAWDDAANGGRIEGALFRGIAGGPKTPYCFGDGSGTACPCGNNSSNGSQSGCLNSLGMAGHLVAVGDASTTADTLVLNASGLPLGNTQPFFFQATGIVNGGAGAAFGDGLRCASGSVIRLGTSAGGGGAWSLGYGVPGSQLVSVRGAVPAAGATRHYQVNYRNAASFCTSATFNTTNGVTVAWTS